MRSCSANTSPSVVSTIRSGPRRCAAGAHDRRSDGRQRERGEARACARAGRGWRPGAGTRRSTSTSAWMSSGCRAATPTLVAPPIELPITIDGPWACNSAVTAARCEPIVAGVDVRLRPKPGRSSAVTRAPSRRASAAGRRAPTRGCSRRARGRAARAPRPGRGASPAPSRRCGPSGRRRRTSARASGPDILPAPVWSPVMTGPGVACMVIHRLTFASAAVHGRCRARAPRRRSGALLGGVRRARGRFGVRGRPRRRGAAAAWPRARGPHRRVVDRDDVRDARRALELRARGVRAPRRRPGRDDRRAARRRATTSSGRRPTSCTASCCWPGPRSRLTPPARSPSRT